MITTNLCVSESLEALNRFSIFNVYEISVDFKIIKMEKAVKMQVSRDLNGRQQQDIIKLKDSLISH